MKIYTKTGDKGSTSLYDQTRVSKDDIRVESYGTIDELNSHIGFARQFIDNEDIVTILLKIQRNLFNVAGELAMQDGTQFPERIQEQHIKELESIIDSYLNEMNKDQAFQFIIPGSSKASASLHVSRTICRRAERRMITLSASASISETVLKYINRLSDTLYTLGRYLENVPILVEFKK